MFIVYIDDQTAAATVHARIILYEVCANQNNQILPRYLQWSGGVYHLANSANYGLLEEEEWVAKLLEETCSAEQFKKKENKYLIVKKIVKIQGREKKSDSKKCKALILQKKFFFCEMLTRRIYLIPPLARC